MDMSGFKLALGIFGVACFIGGCLIAFVTFKLFGFL